MQLEKDLINGGINVSAPKFISDLLKSENVTEFEKTPTSASFLNDDHATDQPIDKTLFASKLMKIMWLARLCRNDILFAISYMSSRVSNPTTESLQLFAYIDASYALHKDMKGQTGIVITLGKNGPPVYCKSRKQKLVSRSSTESELIALNDGLPEVIWAKQFMTNLGYNQKMITVFEDNQSSIILAKNGKGSTISTKEMMADILTKPITGRLFFQLRDMILNTEQK